MERRRARGRPTAGGRDPDVQIDVTALAGELSGIRRAVVAAAEAWGMSAGALVDVALAVSEACSNVVAHAYIDATAPGPLYVETHRRGDEFVVAVSDEGTGIVPRADSPGLGFGLPLMLRLTHRLEIGSNGRGGAKVTMAFARAG